MKKVPITVVPDLFHLNDRRRSAWPIVLKERERSLNVVSVDMRNDERTQVLAGGC